MKLALTNQRLRFGELLARHASLPLSFEDAARFPEHMTCQTLPLKSPIESLRRLNLKFLLDYDIFPGAIMDHLPQWTNERRAMRVGDLILQQVFLPPLPRCSLKLIFAVRVLEIFDSDRKIGFTYGTLRGHVEDGISEFFAELRGGEVALTIHTFSRPALLLGRLVAPIFTRPYQAHVTRRAIRHMCQAFARENSALYSGSCEHNLPS